MKKSGIKDYMIVETGFENQKYLVLKGKLVDDELNGYSLDDFNDDLTHKTHKPESISAVYAPVDIEFPFELDIEEIFSVQNPKVLWKRKPTKLSRKLLSKMDEKQGKKYIDKLVFPVVIVE